MDALRKSSKTWYQRDKETAATANTAALRLLHWIIDEVIAHRRSRAFLLERSQSNSLIDSLFDARVIHFGVAAARLQKFTLSDRPNGSLG